LTIDRKRNFANIERRLSGGDGQRLQHFMSYSPWSGAAVFRQIQHEIVTTPELSEGGTLILDESADEKAGPASAGVSHQYNGRIAKVDLCRVDTCLIYANLTQRLWTMADAELFIAHKWFSAEYAQLRARVGIPPARRFATKLELGLQMIRRCQHSGIRFDVVACDSLYGRDWQFRASLHALNVVYAAQVPISTLVRVTDPRRRQPSPGADSHEVRELAHSERTRWQRIELRHSERGMLAADFALFRVWPVAYGNHTTTAEWLVIRRIGEPRQYSYTLINAAADTPPAQLYEWSTRRYFVERTFEDAKSELGWAEFAAQKYRAWEHHLALTGAALWFAAQTKLELSAAYAPDAELAAELKVVVLPALSTANLRELMRAVLPVPQLTREEARELVVKHLVSRARSTASRLGRRKQLIDTS